jgi:hypothetical protein
MTPKPPLPVLKNFLLCREILQDKRTNQHIIISPLSSLSSSTFPTVARLMAFVQMTSMHGTYAFTFQLQNKEDQVLWEDNIDAPFETSDPLALNTLTFYALAPYLPRAGNYDVVFLANGEEVGRHMFVAKTSST